MSFVSKTWAIGDILTAADMNTYTRDNGKWLSHSQVSGGAPMCRVWNASVQSSISTASASTFDTDIFDVGAMHNPASNPTRLTVPTGGDGTFLVGGTLMRTTTYTSGVGSMNTQLRKNGATIFAFVNMFLSLSGSVIQSLSALYPLAAADYVEIVTGYANYTNVDINVAADYTPTFWAIWMGV